MFMFIKSEYGETVNVNKVLIMELETQNDQYLLRLHTKHTSALLRYDSERARQERLMSLLMASSKTTWIPFADRFYLRQSEVEAILETSTTATIFIGDKKFEFVTKTTNLNDIPKWSLGG